MTIKLAQPASYCDFNVVLSVSNPTPVENSAVILLANCSGSGCPGVRYTFSPSSLWGYGNSMKLGAYLYYPNPKSCSVEASKPGCPSKSSSSSFNIVPSNSGRLCSSELITGYGNVSENYTYGVNTNAGGSYIVQINYSKWEVSLNATGTVKVNGGVIKPLVYPIPEGRITIRMSVLQRTCQRVTIAFK